jgi:hypothetical protein
MFAEPLYRWLKIRGRSATMKDGQQRPNSSGADKTQDYTCFKQPLLEAP